METEYHNFISGIKLLYQMTTANDTPSIINPTNIETKTDNDDDTKANEGTSSNDNASNDTKIYESLGLMIHNESLPQHSKFTIQIPKYISKLFQLICTSFNKSLNLDLTTINNMTPSTKSYFITTKADDDSQSLSINFKTIGKVFKNLTSININDPIFIINNFTFESFNNFINTNSINETKSKLKTISIKCNPNNWDKINSLSNEYNPKYTKYKWKININQSNHTIKFLSF